VIIGSFNFYGLNRAYNGSYLPEKRIVLSKKIAFTGKKLTLSAAWLSRPWDYLYRKETPNLLKKIVQVDKFLYRGPMPGISGLKKLRESKNIDVIIDLKINSNRRKKRLKAKAKELGIKYYNVPINSFIGLTERQEEKIFAVLLRNIKHKKNVYVHCLHGVDRTGSIIARYRMKIQGWNFYRAFKEMWDMGHKKHYKMFPNFKKYLERGEPLGNKAFESII